jgi:DNA adenine methylase
MFDDDDGEGAVGLNDYLLGVVRKNAWGSPGGKVKLAKTLLPMLAKSTHDTYTEVFAGSGSVFFRKDRVPVEALNDYNPEIAQALKTIQDLTDSDVSYLSKLGWVADKGRFNRLAASDPEKMSKVERLHRHMYLTRFSFGYMVPAGFNTKAQGEVTKIWKRVEKARERLKGVKIYKGDYEIPARKHDGASSLHFLDPPYSGYNAAILEGAFDEHRFMKFMQSLEGNFLLTYGVRGELPKLVKSVDKWLVKRITPLRTFGSSPKMGSYAGAKGLGTLIVTNYDMSGKSADASLRKQGYDVAGLDDDEAIAKMFVGYQPTPTWEMATISRMGSRVARSVGADLDRYEPLLKKLQDREPLSDNDVLTLANEVALLKSLGRNAEKQFAALGGTATEVWCSEALEDIIERDERVGKRYHSIGFDGRESVMPETVVVMRDCLTATRDGQLVCRSAEIIDAVEKSIPTLGLVDGTGAEAAVYEHMPLYDLVLVPSARFGEIQRVQKVLADFDLTPGDHGELSLQTWGGAAGDLKMRLWKEGEDHWQGGAISKGAPRSHGRQGRGRHGHPCRRRGPHGSG